MEISQIESLDPERRLWVYNGLDCLVTHKVWEELQTSRTEYSDISYNFVRAMQAPALEMMLRGIKIDLYERDKFVGRLQKQKDKVQKILNRIAFEVWRQELNPNSPAQLKKFFYDVMKIPEQYKWKKGKKKITTDNEAMEKIQAYYHARPIAKCIITIRDLVKKIGVLHTGVDSDGRMRTSYNVTGTETGRWSSSENAFRTGTNLQNITDLLRGMFVADDGMLMFYADLEQAESRLVAYLSGDEAYIEACESGDLHTTVCKMIWPELGWTGDLEYDKEHIAGQVFYKHFTYRDMAKRGGHGTNYYGTARTMAMHLKVEVKIMEEFQDKYFKAFPRIREWHNSVATQLQTQGYMDTPLGRRRHFFGRLDDDATLREAIAFVPQSTIGELLNLGLLAALEI